jgi:putative membrane protein
MMMGFGFLGMLLLGGALLALLALGVGGAVLVFRGTTDARSPGGQRQPTARQVLDERFARGEIGREEYEAIRARIDR